MEKGKWAGRATSGAEFALIVTPGARRAAIDAVDGIIRVMVRAAPQEGAANAAVQALLARALGVAKTRLTLLRGATSRHKAFRLD